MWMLIDPVTIISVIPHEEQVKSEHRVSALGLLSHVGFAFYQQWRRRLRMNDMDYGRVARQMRKAGIPLDVALQILFHRKERAA